MIISYPLSQISQLELVIVKDFGGIAYCMSDTFKKLKTF